jgi:endonuclease YncB( thermonuclease family)
MPNTGRNSAWLLALIFITFLSCTRAPSQDIPQASPSPIADSTTVYVTDTGTKYHVAGCKSLSKSKTEISFDDAIAQGYEPCAICYPATTATSASPKKTKVKTNVFPMTITGTVVAIADGDTITVLVGTEQFKIRLDAIDCPEKKQAYGQKAKEYISGLVFSKTVSVEISGMDRYGRYLGVVTVAGVDVNRSMIRNGYAWHYKQYSKDTELDELEALARSERLGLWKDDQPIPPWDFRK